MFTRFWIIILTISLALSACADSSSRRPSPSDPSGANPSPEKTEIGQPHQTFAPEDTEIIIPPDEAPEELMNGLTSNRSTEIESALESILSSGNKSYIPVLIELMRAAQIGLVSNVNYSALITALEKLSDQQLGDSWPDWVEWYGETDLIPPPGFTSWKGRLLSRIDPRFGLFLQDEHPSRIRVEEIQWGGVIVDGIPALDNPTMIPADQADYLEPGEPVFGIALNGEARAYPLRIMDWHEMANDVVGGVPVSLAYCTLCGAGIAYEGRATDGGTYTFGSSGFLFRSNKLMYDRQTSTLWNQLTGEPVLGELANTELQLSYLPVVLTSWSDWMEQHPDTQVLKLETGYERIYEPGAAYGDYFSSADTMFPVWQRSKELEDKSRIYALRLDGVPKAYAVEKLIDEQVVNDVLGEIPLVLIAQRGSLEVEGMNLRVGPVRYDSGGEVRAYQRGEHIFSRGTETGTILDEEGNVWRLTEEALIGPNDESAPRLNGHLAYWFGWFAFFPNTLIYK